MKSALSLASYSLSRSQSKIEEGQAEVAAKGEELRLKQREADRKDRLASALASQNAMSGARGVAAFEGSPLTVIQDSIDRAKTGSERDKFSTEISALAIRSEARARARMQRVSAGLKLGKALIDDAQSSASMT